ncbi:MAG: succinate dehydrogenase, hydrophobic membrane anchor protein [Alphaproteobacteria bacterium]|nr:succinate dehydrogenase, hydrophobic membrane anchor protein [Alphaproteobacteria bacterium]
MTMRTPLKSVRHLGSAKEGADHFWLQRITALANVFLGLFLVWLVVRLVGADYVEVKRLLANPLIALPLLLLVLSSALHMRVGMQVVIEDYIHTEGLKLLLLIVNTFFAIGVGAVAVFSILKLSFGG